VSAAVGTPIDRVDGRRKVTGQAQYAAEFRPEGLVHAVAIQSPIARGRLLRIDASAARRSPGVLAVLTRENAPKVQKPKNGESGSGAPKLGEEMLPFSDDEIHFAGQYVALVVAEKLPQARRAARLVRVDYREEPPDLDMTGGTASARTSRPDKVFGKPGLQHKRGDVDAALAAPGVVRHDATYTTPVETHNPMELSATIARFDGDRLTVWDSTQAVVGTRNFLAQAFDLPPENVRAICPFVGGAFGCKGFQWPHTLLAAMAARAVGRPVSLVVTRKQMFQSTGHRPPTIQKLTLGAARDGKLVAIRHDTTSATSPVTEFVEPAGKSTSAVLYGCDNVETPHHLARVNVAAPTPMRAPGECPGSYALESAMDELAVALAMDPVALRLKNDTTVDGSDGKPFSSRRLKECFALGVERFGWERRDPRPGSMKDGDLLVGWGVATALYPGRRWPASAWIRLTPDGKALVRAASQDLGTGAYTVFTEVAADALGLPVEAVTFELGDSSFPPAPVSGGSNSTASVSEAILKTAAELRRSIGAPEGAALADAVRTSGTPAEARGSAAPEKDDEQKFSIHSFGAQFCEVKVDPTLARVRVTRWVSVMNVGRVVNPKTARSQVLGGVTMGIGMALLEHTAYDPRTGRPVTASLADYLVPVNADVGTIEVHFVGEPDPAINTLGCRGIGEIGITGAAAAVANAVYHATGRRVRDLPITPDKLL